MNWAVAIEKDREMLKRIAAVLLSLAAAAERAAGRSLLVRCLVLWLLRRAEPVARAFAVECGAPPPVLAGHAAPRSAPRSGNGPDDAARLAATFRALAAVFRKLARLAVRFALARSRRLTVSGLLPSGHSIASRLLRLLAARWPDYADTS